MGQHSINVYVPWLSALLIYAVLSYLCYSHNFVPIGPRGSLIGTGACYSHRRCLFRIPDCCRRGRRRYLGPKTASPLGETQTRAAIGRKGADNVSGQPILSNVTKVKYHPQRGRQVLWVVDEALRCSGVGYRQEQVQFRCDEKCLQSDNVTPHPIPSIRTGAVESTAQHLIIWSASAINQ